MIDREVVLLKIRKSIADIEWLTANARQETVKYEEWQCNWQVLIDIANEEIERLFALLEDKIPGL